MPHKRTLKINLLNDKKELSEQMMITDLMRNNLLAVAGGIKV
ncbi:MULTISPECIES: chorismate-binding protein [Campylobacter]|nr:MULTISPECIES: chorismate-binding protein [unclassified Campylobacter]